MNDKKKDSLISAIKSFVIGATMTVPGVSGGSMAMVLGIYDRIIGAVPDVFSKNFKSAFLFLLICGVSGMVGALGASPVMGYLLSHFFMIVMFFFLGAIAGSVPMILKKSEVRKNDWFNIFFAIIGVFIVLCVGMIPDGFFSLGDSNVFAQILCGILVSVGFVLPGISFSYLMVVLGLYDSLIKNLSARDFVPLLPLSIGLACGIVLLAGLLKKAMEKKPRITFPVILGFVLGSLPQVFPGVPKGSELVFSLISFCVGFGAIYYTSLDRKKN